MFYTAPLRPLCAQRGNRPVPRPPLRHLLQRPNAITEITVPTRPHTRQRATSELLSSQGHKCGQVRIFHAENTRCTQVFAWTYHSHSPSKRRGIQLRLGSKHASHSHELRIPNGEGQVIRCSLVLGVSHCVKYQCQNVHCPRRAREMSTQTESWSLTPKPRVPPECLWVQGTVTKYTRVRHLCTDRQTTCRNMHHARGTFPSH